MNITQILNKSKRQQWKIRVTTKHPDGDRYDGIIRNVGKNIIVIDEFDGFEYNSVEIVPKKFIKSCRDSKYEKCANKIIRQNREILKLSKAPWLDKAQNIKDVLANIYKRRIWPAIETIDGGKTALFIGPITQINDGSFTIYCYDATGNWEKTYEIDYDEVFRIELFSSYIKHFNNYMKSKSKNRPWHVV